MNYLYCLAIGEELGWKCLKTGTNVSPTVWCELLEKSSQVTSLWNEVTSVVHSTLCIFGFVQVNVFARAKSTGKSQKDSPTGGKSSLLDLLFFFLKRKE